MFRWRNQVNPYIKRGEWTAEEDRSIIHTRSKSFSKLGSEINGLRLPGGCQEGPTMLSRIDVTPP